ncbi:MAG: UTP--glucose-1-phosphate uridylyltransferase GalU [Candidatus Hydrothermarchaeaceae archaeon]
MKAVIPAAGIGTRFLPATKAQPKEMLPVFDKPTIQYVVEEAIASGLKDILIITGRGKRAIEDHFDKSVELELMLKNNEKNDYLKEIQEISDLAEIYYIRQKEQRGLGDAIYTARKFVSGEPFAILLGDTITKSTPPCTKQLMDVYDKYGRSIIAVEEVSKEMISSYGIIDCGAIEKSVFLVKDLVEKPKPKDAPSNLGILGRYILTPEIFRCIEKTAPGVGGEIQLTDALKILRNRQRVYAYKFEGERYDIGNKLEWLKSSIKFALDKEDIRDELLSYLTTLVGK